MFLKQKNTIYLFLFFICQNVGKHFEISVNDETCKRNLHIITVIFTSISPAFNTQFVSTFSCFPLFLMSAENIDTLFTLIWLCAYPNYANAYYRFYKETTGHGLNFFGIFWHMIWACFSIWKMSLYVTLLFWLVLFLQQQLFYCAINK